LITTEVSNKKGELARLAEEEKNALLVKAETEAVGKMLEEYDRLRAKSEAEV
jgi:hypothetical protein